MLQTGIQALASASLVELRYHSLHRSVGLFDSARELLAAILNYEPASVGVCVAHSLVALVANTHLMDDRKQQHMHATVLLRTLCLTCPTLAAQANALDALVCVLLDPRVKGPEGYQSFRYVHDLADQIGHRFLASPRCRCLFSRSSVSRLLYGLTPAIVAQASKDGEGDVARLLVRDHSDEERERERERDRLGNLDSRIRSLHSPSPHTTFSGDMLVPPLLRVARCFSGLIYFTAKQDCFEALGRALSLLALSECGQVPGSCDSLLDLMYSLLGTRQETRQQLLGWVRERDHYRGRGGRGRARELMRGTDKDREKERGQDQETWKGASAPSTDLRQYVTVVSQLFPYTLSDRHNLVNSYLSVVLLSFLKAGLFDVLIRLASAVPPADTSLCLNPPDSHYGMPLPSSPALGMGSLSPSMGRVPVAVQCADVSHEATILVYIILAMADELLPGEYRSQFNAFPRLVSEAASLSDRHSLSFRSALLLRNIQYLREREREKDADPVYGLPRQVDISRVSDSKGKGGGKLCMSVSERVLQESLPGHGVADTQGHSVRHLLVGHMGRKEFLALLKRSGLKQDPYNADWAAVSDLLIGPWQEIEYLELSVRKGVFKALFKYLMDSDKGFFVQALSPASPMLVRTVLDLFTLLGSSDTGVLVLSQSRFGPFLLSCLHAVLQAEETLTHTAEASGAGGAGTSAGQGQGTDSPLSYQNRSPSPGQTPKTPSYALRRSAESEEGLMLSSMGVRTTHARCFFSVINALLLTRRGSDYMMRTSVTIDSRKHTMWGLLSAVSETSRRQYLIRAMTVSLQPSPHTECPATLLEKVLTMSETHVSRATKYLAILHLRTILMVNPCRDTKTWTIGLLNTQLLGARADEVTRTALSCIVEAAQDPATLEVVVNSIDYNIVLSKRDGERGGERDRDRHRRRDSDIGSSLAPVKRTEALLLLLLANTLHNGQIPLVLRNTSDDHLMYKILTTRPRMYVVRPPCGILRPKESASITILIAMPPDTSVSTVADTRFRVDYYAVGDAANSGLASQLREVLERDGGRGNTIMPQIVRGLFSDNKPAHHPRITLPVVIKEGSAPPSAFNTPSPSQARKRGGDRDALSLSMSRGYSHRRGSSVGLGNQESGMYRMTMPPKAGEAERERQREREERCERDRAELERMHRDLEAALMEAETQTQRADSITERLHEVEHAAESERAATAHKMSRLERDRDVLKVKLTDAERERERERTEVKHERERSVEMNERKVAAEMDAMGYKARATRMT
ncbi:vesicle-associated membrane-protein-associated protein, partial [Kipferlia bialata]|eukprot:g4735.t1